jgi:hypothetical protein
MKSLEGEEEICMISKGKLPYFQYLILLGLIIIFILSGCSPPAGQGTETPGAAAGNNDNGSDVQVTPGTCPPEGTFYNLYVDHLAVEQFDLGNGETFYLKFENIPQEVFPVEVGPMGLLTNENYNYPIKISYQGTATHPNDNDCPVQTFEGIWEMQADISGLCQKGIVYLEIKEEWISPVLHSSCGDPPGEVPETVSAPELELVFDLSEDFPHDGIEIPEGGYFHATYQYTLLPLGENDLPLAPLPDE